MDEASEINKFEDVKVDVPPETGSRDWFEKNRNRLQGVLPETIFRVLNDHYEDFTSKGYRELQKYNWLALEFHDIEDLPSVNVLFVENDERAKVIVEGVTERMRKVKEFLGYSKEYLTPLTVYVDPKAQSFQGASAMFEMKDKGLWISSQNGSHIDHELFHWATTFPDDHRSTLLVEGIANWGAWQIKNEEEKKLDPAGNYMSITRDRLSRYLKREELNLDEDYDDRQILARYIVGVLFDVISEEFGDDLEQIGNMWIASMGYEKPSEWLREIGLDPSDIEEKWRDRVFGKRNPGLRERLSKKKS